jgi:hypothetical protein
MFRLDRGSFEAFVIAAIRDVHDTQARPALAGKGQAGMHSPRFIGGGHDGRQFAGRAVPQPQDTLFGNNRRFADLDDFMQQRSQCLRRRKPMHDLKDLD